MLRRGGAVRGLEVLGIVIFQCKVVILSLICMFNEIRLLLGHNSVNLVILRHRALHVEHLVTCIVVEIVILIIE